MGIRLSRQSVYTEEISLLIQLEQAIEKGDAEKVEAKLNQVSMAVSQYVLEYLYKTKWFRHPLYLAVKSGNAEVVKLLLSHEVTYHAATFDRTLFDNCDSRGHIQMFDGFLDFTAKMITECGNENASQAIEQMHKKSLLVRLLMAIREGDASKVEALLNHVSQADLQNHFEYDLSLHTGHPKRSPLFIAAKHGHADLVDLLLRHRMIAYEDCFYETPLHIAAENGHAKVVEAFIDFNEKVRTEFGQGILQEHESMCYEDECDRVKFYKNQDGVQNERMLHLEFMRIKDKFTGYTPFLTAVTNLQPIVMELLMRKGTNCSNSADNKGRTALHIVISQMSSLRRQDRTQSHWIVLKLLASSNDINFNALDFTAITPLNTAMVLVGQDYGEWKNAETLKSVVKFLLENGADINRADSVGETPLMKASERGCCHIVQVLLEWKDKSGAKLLLDLRDVKGETALIKAAENHHVKIVKLLLDSGASVNVRDNCGFTALHTAMYEPNVLWADYIYFCEKTDVSLLKHRINNIVDVLRYGRNQGTRGIIKDCTDAVKSIRSYTRAKEDIVMIILGNSLTDVNAIDLKGRTPLDLAAFSSLRMRTETFEALTKNLAHMNKADRRELEHLAKESTLRIPEYPQDECIRTPFHRLAVGLSIYDFTNAASRNYFTKGDELSNRNDTRPLKYRVVSDRINRKMAKSKSEHITELAPMKDINGRTVLHYLVMCSSLRFTIPNIVNLSMSEIVLSKTLPFFQNDKCSINMTDKYGKTPLHYAHSDRGKYDLLVEHGAKENVIDNFLKTPRDLREASREKLARILNIFGYACCTKFQRGYVKTEYRFYDQLVQEKKEQTLISEEGDEDAHIVSEEQSSTMEQLLQSFYAVEIYTITENARMKRIHEKLLDKMRHFVARLSRAIEVKEPRFTSEPILVGSSEEGTKLDIAGDFDFTLRLVDLSKLCEVLPSPVSPSGFVHLKLKMLESATTEKFMEFFSDEKLLLANKVKTRFHMVFLEVMNDAEFWSAEDFFELDIQEENLVDMKKEGLNQTLMMKLIHPVIGDEDGDLFVDHEILVDIVPCIHVDCFWPDDALDGLNDEIKDVGCNLVFDSPQRYYPWVPFDETYVRISFAVAETQIIKRSKPIAKAVYVVLKDLFRAKSKYCYGLRSSFLYCIEALKSNEDSESGSVQVTKASLDSWTRGILKSLIFFYCQDFIPCYVMPSFDIPMFEFLKHDHTMRVDRLRFDPESRGDSAEMLRFPNLYASVVQDPYICRTRNPLFEHFDRDLFLRKLSE